MKTFFTRQIQFLQLHHRRDRFHRTTRNLRAAAERQHAQQLAVHREGLDTLVVQRLSTIREV